MADLSDLRTAVRDAVDEAQAPAFESLVRRARVRRRRRQISLAAAAVAVLAGAAALVAPGGRPATPPSPAEQTGTATPSVTPSPRPAPTTALGRLQAMSVDDLVARGHLYSEGSAGGQLLAVWSVCVNDSQYCRYAWRLVDRHGEVAEGAAGDGVDNPGPDVYAGAGAFVLKAWDRPGLAVEPDGTTKPLVSGRVNPLAHDAVAVRTGGRRMELADPVTGETQPLPDVPGSDALADAAVAADGTLWALPAFAGPGKVEVSWLRDGLWRSHVIVEPSRTRMAVPGALAVTGTWTGPTRVAALSSYDGATVLPVGVLAVSVDGGATWTHLTQKDVPFHAVDSMAATAGGTLFVADPDGALWRSTNASWTGFARVTGVGRVGGLEPAGEQVLARTSARRPADIGLVLVGADGSLAPVRAR
jgi:hypothetical protein